MLDFFDVAGPKSHIAVWQDWGKTAALVAAGFAHQASEHPAHRQHGKPEKHAGEEDGEDMPRSGFNAFQMIG